MGAWEADCMKIIIFRKSIKEIKGLHRFKDIVRLWIVRREWGGNSTW